MSMDKKEKKAESFSEAISLSPAADLEVLLCFRLFTTKRFFVISLSSLKTSLLKKQAGKHGLAQEAAKPLQ